MPDSPELEQDVRLLLGVCGSVSAVAVPHLLAWTRMTLPSVITRVVMTAMAERIIGRQAVRPFMSGPVVSTWDDVCDLPVPHVEFAQWAEAILILPASANFLGKVSNGIADDLLTSTVLAASCPTVVVPATNAAMWEKRSVQRNVTQLRADGYEVVEPKQGVKIANGERELGSLGDYRPAVLKAIGKAISRRGSSTAPLSSGRPSEPGTRPFQE